MDVIDGLLRIKRIREDSREADMRHARNKFDEAAEALRRAAEAQKQRDVERTEREQAMYRDVCSRVVFLRELDDLKYEVDTMKIAAKADAQAVVQAQEQRVARRQAFDESVGAWHHAMQATQKFKDLSAEQGEERARHAEWLADLEMEEHTGRSPAAEAMAEEAAEA